MTQARFGGLLHPNDPPRDTRTEPLMIHYLLIPPGSV